MKSTPTHIIKRTHNQLKALLADLEAAPSSEKQRWFLELAAWLELHEVMERGVLYPACQGELGMEQPLDDAATAHSVIAFLLTRSHTALGTADFDYQMCVLKAAVLRHIDEEEAYLLPLVDKTFRVVAQEALGEVMRERAKESDSLGVGARSVFSPVSDRFPLDSFNRQAEVRAPHAP